MDILEHLGMKVPDIEGHGVIISRATVPCYLYMATVRSAHFSHYLVGFDQLQFAKRAMGRNASEQMATPG